MNWRAIRQKWMALINRIGTIFYPPRCIFCRRILDRDGICDQCRSSLPFLHNMRAKAPPFVLEAYTPFGYEGCVRRAIINYKFHHATAYAKSLAEMMESCIRVHLEGRFDCVVWVPISAKRMRKRGYDQAHLLAEHIADSFDIPLVAALRKIRDNPSQTSKRSEAARRANVIGVYEVQNHEEIIRKRILLVDDVLTTGATISECARMLKTAGAESVYVVTVAKTQKHKNRKKELKNV